MDIKSLGDIKDHGSISRTATAIYGKGFALYGLKKYREAYEEFNKIILHYEAGNSDNLPNDFAACAYLACGACLSKLA